MAAARAMAAPIIQRVCFCISCTSLVSSLEISRLTKASEAIFSCTVSIVFIGVCEVRDTPPAGAGEAPGAPEIAVSRGLKLTISPASMRPGRKGKIRLKGEKNNLFIHFSPFNS